MTTNNLINNTKQYIAGIHQFITVGTGSTDVSIQNIISQPDVNLMTLQNGNVGFVVPIPTLSLNIVIILQVGVDAKSVNNLSEPSSIVVKICLPATYSVLA